MIIKTNINIKRLILKHYKLKTQEKHTGANNCEGIAIGKLLIGSHAYKYILW